MAGIKLLGINKYFGNTPAVTTMNLDIMDGEFLVFVGPSGCGKTTTLRMIAGLETPTEGTIYIGENDVTFAEPKDRDIAMVFQNYALYPHMKVYGNMAYGLKLRKLVKKEIDERIRTTAEMLGITPLLDRYPRQLSGGQQQRVALGRAIVRNPQVFLMDEPLSNLDAKLRVQTRAELIKLHQKLKTTVVYVTHDQTEAMTMGTRIVVMKDGVVQQIGTPIDIYNNPANIFVGGFVGSPPMHFIKGKIKQTGQELHFVGQGMFLKLPLTIAPSAIEQNVLLGLRPEGLSVVDNIETTDGIHCLVEVVENIGSEGIIHAKTEELSDIVIRLGSDEALPAVGSKICIKPTRGNLHLFNADNGNSILSFHSN